MFSGLIEKVKRNKLWAACLLLSFLTIFVLAWQCDDAYHAHRMSWNLVHGNGFVYNPGERVSATTAPLFTLLTTLVYFIFRDMYWSSMLFCIACSLAAIYTMQKFFCRNPGNLLVSTFLLACCPSFVSYTTSGLENPLLFLLAGIAVALFLKYEFSSAKRLLPLSFVSSLLIATRMDNALIVLPALVYVFLIKAKNKPLAILCGIAGMLPFIAWELFSLAYYGFLFPNTAYAKLNTGFPLVEYLARGVLYFIAMAYHDPLSLLLPAIYIAASARKRNGRHIAVSLGIVLYYAYIAYIGGDFMKGRFLSVPFFLSVFCILDLFADDMPELKIGSFNTPIVKPAVLGLIAGIFLACVNPLPMFPSWTSATWDERDGYFKYTSIFFRYAKSVKNRAPPYEAELGRWWEVEEELAQVKKLAAADGGGWGIMRLAPGIVLFYEGRGVYCNDTIGLGDPLLARLPAIYEPGWVIGHMRRAIPEGYQESARSGENKIVDPSLREYYEALRLIARSEKLFAPERIKAIRDMNMGKYDHLIEEYIAKGSAE